ncbi:hypothetical protein FEM48_Zijuj01G0166000 [Ziziphus jujuba var. spinosa]|uniref:Uncharacterized protein n=1 Tax=Ziziphus jujuba var. spinosa TaxID=714518 RepID=A0A978W2C8_ZIZJJ|nr:hypothetical protein FEM48_Zijuj01G0166000 [Ziziphus jujuba var. spinosa]
MQRSREAMDVQRERAASIVETIWWTCFGERHQRERGEWDDEFGTKLIQVENRVCGVLVCLRLVVSPFFYRVCVPTHSLLVPIFLLFHVFDRVLWYHLPSCLLFCNVFSLYQTGAAAYSKNKVESKLVSQFQGLEAAAAPMETPTVTLLIRHLPEVIPENTLSRLFIPLRRFLCPYMSYQWPVEVSWKSLKSQKSLINPNMVILKLIPAKVNTLHIHLFSSQHALLFLKIKLNKSRNVVRCILLNPLPLNLVWTIRSSSSAVRHLLYFVVLDGYIVDSMRLVYFYPKSVYYRYAYSPPHGNILTNIINALIAVPCFYTPFEVDESGASRGQKRVRRETIIGPVVDRDVAYEVAGLKPAILVPKEIPVIKKKNPVLQIKIIHKVFRGEQKDDSITRGCRKKESKYQALCKSKRQKSKSCLQRRYCHFQCLRLESSEWLCVQKQAHDHPVWPESFSYETKLTRSYDVIKVIT